MSKSPAKSVPSVPSAPAPRTAASATKKPVSPVTVNPSAKAAAPTAATAAAKAAPKPAAKSTPAPATKPAATPPQAAAPKAAASIPTKAPPPPVTKPATPVAPAKAPSKSRSANRPTPAELAEPTQRTIPLPPPNRPPPSNVVDLPRPVRQIDPKLVNVWKTKAGRDLTDDELLAMPDSEYMNDKQLEFFRSRLMKQRDDLLDNAGETTEHLREDTSIVPDPADRATIEEEHALELRTRDRERKLLKKISQSIARIEAGDYGFCDETGEPIGMGRLLARPTATLSLEAQQRREMKQKMFGD